MSYRIAHPPGYLSRITCSNSFFCTVDCYFRPSALCFLLALFHRLGSTRACLIDSPETRIPRHLEFLIHVRLCLCEAGLSGRASFQGKKNPGRSDTPGTRPIQPASALVSVENSSHSQARSPTSIASIVPFRISRGWLCGIGSDWLPTAAIDSSRTSSYKGFVALNPTVIHLKD